MKLAFLYTILCYQWKTTVPKCISHGGLRQDYLHQYKPSSSSGYLNNQSRGTPAPAHGGLAAPPRSRADSGSHVLQALQIFLLAVAATSCHVLCNVSSPSPTVMQARAQPPVSGSGWEMACVQTDKPKERNVR